MNTELRDRNNNMIFTGDKLHRVCSIGMTIDVYTVGFGWFTVNEEVIYGVYLYSEEYGSFHNVPFEPEGKLKLINKSRL